MTQHKKHLNRLFGRIMQQKADSNEQSLFWRWLWRLDVRKQAANWTKEEKELARERIWGAVLLETQPAPGEGSRKYPWKKFIAAAAIIGIILGGWFWLNHNTSQRRKQLFVYSSDACTVQQLLLPDSTEVILNYNSTLQYNGAYNEADRRVSLVGEAYFIVHKDGLRPFVVEVENLEVRALGTAFNVESREKESQIRVALTEGQVAVTSKDSIAQRQFLYPGQLLRYERVTKSFVTNAFTTNIVAWTTGGLSFNGIPLTEVLDRLAAHYQLRIDYPREKLKGKTVTSSFEKTSWQNVLSNILFVHDLSYTVKDNLIIIR